jgi:hypothetical protein
VYIYWYDAHGNSTRLWPEDAAIQEKLTKVDSPKKSDLWHRVNGELGAEFLLVAARDEPLKGAELDRFESQLAFSKNEIRLDGVFPVGSKDVSRGLSGVVQSRKNPLDSEFESTLEQTFPAYHGLVIPHQAVTASAEKKTP